MNAAKFSSNSLMNSQYRGKKDTWAIQVIFGISFKLSLLVTGLVSFVCIIFQEAFMTLYINDAHLIPIGAGYPLFILFDYTGELQYH